MCAIDALGLPAVTGRDGRITSADPLDGQPVEVTVRDGAWTWTPGSAVVIIARATDCGSWESMCPNTTFHASRDTARAYLTSRGNLDAQVLDQDTAIECGPHPDAQLGEAVPPGCCSAEPESPSSCCSRACP